MTATVSRNPFVRKARPRGIARWIPGLNVFRTYERAWLAKDVVTDIGIGFLIKTIAPNLREAIRAKEVVFAEHGEETLYGRKTQVLLIQFCERFGGHSR